MTSDSPALTSTQRRSIGAAIIGVSSVAAAFTFCAPILSLLMERAGETSTYIGWFATIGAITTVMLTPIAPRLMARFGSRQILFASIVLGALVFPLYYIFPIFEIWFLLRFIQGLAFTTVFVVSETWINQIAPEHMRGRILSLYAIGLSGGFALGSGMAAVMIKFAGLDGPMPYLLGMAIALIGIAPQFMRALSPVVPPSPEESSFRAMGAIIKAAPAVLACGLVFGAIEYSLFSLLPIYGVKLNLTEAAAGSLLIALPIGNILLQWPIGVLADRINRRAFLAGLLVFCGLCALAIAGVGANYWALIILLACFTGAATGIYTLGLVILSQKFAGGRIAVANASFILMYGFGSLISPVLSGTAMDKSGPVGFPLVLAAFAFLGLLVLAVAHIKAKTDA